MIVAAALVLMLQAEEAPRRSPVFEGLAWLVAHQREDGSWGAPPPACVCRHVPTPEPGNLESTGLALYAFSGAGYGEYSTDDIRGHRAGDVVRSALEWLIAKQDADGAFDRENASANAVAALAVIEAHVMSQKRKEAAEKAYAWVEKAEIPDVLGRIRQGMVLTEGRIAEIGHEHDAKILALAEALEKEEGDLARWGSLLLKRLSLHRPQDMPAMGIPELDLPQVPVEALNVLANASFLLVDAEPWHEWFARVRDALVPLQRSEEKVCEAGSWDGESFRARVQATALRCLTLEHYCCFYCRSAFRKK
jgi:hypothetical protein